MLGCDTAYEVNRWNHVGGTVGKVPGKDLLEETRIWAIGGDSGYQVQKIKTNSETIHFRLGLESNQNPLWDSNPWSFNQNHSFGV